MYTKNANSLKRAAENFTTYLDTLYYEEKKMSELWDLANKVSEIGYRLDGVKCVAEMLGESMSDDVNSGVAWTIAEIVDAKGKELEDLSSEIMRVGHEQGELIAKYEAIIAKYELKKKKKKKIDMDGRC